MSTLTPTSRQNCGSYSFGGRKKIVTEMYWSRQLKCIVLIITYRLTHKKNVALIQKKICIDPKINLPGAL